MKRGNGHCNVLCRKWTHIVILLLCWLFTPRWLLQLQWMERKWMSPTTHLKDTGMLMLSSRQTMHVSRLQIYFMWKLLKHFSTIWYIYTFNHKIHLYICIHYCCCKFWLKDTGILESPSNQRMESLSNCKLPSSKLCFLGKLNNSAVQRDYSKLLNSIYLSWLHSVMS